LREQVSKSLQGQRLEGFKILMADWRGQLSNIFVSDLLEINNFLNAHHLL